MNRDALPSPQRIVELATGYWSSMVLLTLNECGLFTRLESGGATRSELAQATGLDERALGYLLDAGVNLGLLTLKKERYGNSSEAKAFLVEGSPTSLSGGLKYALDTYTAWGKLPDALRSGEAQHPAATYLGQDPDLTRRFVYAMHDRARPAAMGLGQGIDLTGRSRLLDLGGGSGVYSVMMCQKHPELRAVLYDLPGVLEVASEIIEAESVANRIELRCGDFHNEEDSFGEGFDAVFLNGVFHRESEIVCRGLLTRVHQAMVPGGLLVVSDVMLDETGHGPLFSTLFALNMFLTAPDGGAHSTADQSRWLRAAGFTDVTVKPLPQPSTHTVILATRGEFNR